MVHVHGRGSSTRRYFIGSRVDTVENSVANNTPVVLYENSKSMRCGSSSVRTLVVSGFADWLQRFGALTDTRPRANHS